MGTFEETFVRLNRIVVALALAAIFTIVFLNVVGRYGFGYSPAWAEETARFLMIFGTFAGAGLALREGRLVEIDLFIRPVPERAKKLIRVGAVLVMTAFMITILWYGTKFVSFGWNKETMATGISRGIPYLAIPVGAGLFLIHLAFFWNKFIAREFDDTSNESLNTDAEDLDPASDPRL